MLRRSVSTASPVPGLIAAACNQSAPLPPPHSLHLLLTLPCVQILPPPLARSLKFITRQWCQGQQRNAAFKKTILLDIVLCTVKTTLPRIARDPPRIARGDSIARGPKGRPQRCQANFLRSIRPPYTSVVVARVAGRPQRDAPE